eukprot:jgi/Bigna1/71575/fgenesh1_pg.16_\
MSLFSRRRWRSFCFLSGYQVELSAILSISVNMMPFTYALYGVFRRWLARKSLDSLSQEELNEIYKPNEFYMGQKYANLLAQMFLALTFSPGIPILYWIFGVSLFVGWAVEKWAILRHYRKPDYLGLLVFNNAMWVAKWGVWVHMLAAFVIYADNLLLTSYTLDGGENKEAGGGLKSGGDKWNGFFPILGFWMIIFALLNDYIRYFLTPAINEQINDWMTKTFGLEMGNEAEISGFFEELVKVPENFPTYSICSAPEYMKAFYADGLPYTEPMYVQTKHYERIFGKKKDGTINIVSSRGNLHDGKEEEKGEGKSSTDRTNENGKIDGRDALNNAA